MARDKTLEFEQLPNAAPYYLRAATNWSGGLAAGETIPEIRARIDDLSVRAEHLARYRKVCGFPRADTLPVTYPHVLAFPLHMAVLTHADFPLKLLGLVHTANRIVSSRPIATSERVAIDVSVDGHRETTKGIEFDLLTDVRSAAGEQLWRSSSTMLSRQKTSKSGGADTRSSGPPLLGFTPIEDVVWTIPADIGRRYAAAAGDYNPIHLSAVSAKLFGFKHAIAHGMWSAARAAAVLAEQFGGERRTLDVAFKKPVFLPAEARFKHADHETGSRFALTDTTGEIQHLTGALDVD